MSKKNKRLKLVVKNGGDILAIYDDSLVAMFGEAASVETRRASHVEPDGAEWSADLSPVGGPILRNFETRKGALDAEVRYINQHVIR
jgi:hypothetical protein